jgi:Uncharacterized protein conserved in bacteria
MSSADRPIEARARPVVAAPAAAPIAAANQLAFSSYLRVAAMSAVVLIHTMSAIVGNGAIRGSATWWAGTAIDLGVSWSVPVFIMVSGALLLAPRAGEGARAFYARRLHRIAIPLVVAHVGYLLVRLRWLHEQLTVGDVVRDLLRANLYVQLYFFWIILGLYLVTPLLRSALVGRSRRDLLIIGGGAIAWMWSVRAGAVVLTAIGTSTTVWQPAALTLFAPYIGYFILGYALRDVVLSGRALLVAGLVFVAAEAVVIAQYALWASNPVAATLIGGGYQGLPVAISAIMLFTIVRSLVPATSRAARPPFAAPMRHLGELSLGVFIGHLVVLRLGWMVPGFSFSIVKHSLPTALVLWAGVTMASFAVCAVIARIPVLRRFIGF